MTSRSRIYEALDENSRGDVEKYFHHLCTMIEENSGIHEFNITSVDCYNNNAPFKQDQFTRFDLTNSMDIIDISKGFITMRVNVDVQFLFEDLGAHNLDSKGLPACIYFVGFRSAMNIISVYQVYSQNQLTALKNTKAHQTLGISYMCKAKEEIIGRPYMFSPHSKVMEMDPTVCGTYITLPPYTDRNTKQVITLELVIQVDDIPEFNSFTYWPQFLCKSLQLELATNLNQCMVWCQIPIQKAIENCEIGNDPRFDEADYEQIISNPFVKSTGYLDSTFHACGDFYDCLVGYTSYDTVPFNLTRMTIQVSNLTVETARSYIYGFNIKDSSKRNIVDEFNKNQFIIPSTHVEHYTFPQLPSQTDIKTNLQLSLWNASQIILTFPNSPNTGGSISYNPHLQACQLSVGGTRIIPDKMYNTVNDASHTEMTLAALGLDSLFSANEELLESLTRDRGKLGTWSLHKQGAESYLMVYDLERGSSGCFCDGLSGISIPINFQATFMYGTENPHYYHMVNNQKELRRQNVDIYIVSDSFFACTPNGVQYIKDANSVY